MKTNLLKLILIVLCVVVCGILVALGFYVFTMERTYHNLPNLTLSEIQSNLGNWSNEATIYDGEMWYCFFNFPPNNGTSCFPYTARIKQKIIDSEKINHYLICNITAKNRVKGKGRCLEYHNVQEFNVSLTII